MLRRSWLRHSRSLILDSAVSLALAILGGLIAHYLWTLTEGRIPHEDFYFGSDSDRVVKNLLDPLSSFHRLNVHPLYGLVCIAFQHGFANATELQGPFGALSVLNGGLFAMVVYAAARLWGGGRLAACAAVFFGMACGGFVFWVAVPETHFLAGLTVLGVFILAKWRLAGATSTLLKSAAMFGLGYSMTVTNVVAWLLAKVRYEAIIKRDLKSFIRDNTRQIPDLILAALGGLGLIAVGMAITWYGLYNRLMGRLLDIFREAKYVTVDNQEFGGGFYALGVVGPGGGLNWIIDFVTALAVIFCIWRLRKGPVFIPAFALFAVILHSIYARHEAFLFSANYSPALAVAFALALQSVRPRVGPVALMACAVVLGYSNLDAYKVQLLAAAPTSQPIESYGLVQKRAAKLPPLPPGILRAPN